MYKSPAGILGMLDQSCDTHVNMLHISWFCYLYIILPFKLVCCWKDCKVLFL